MNVMVKDGDQEPTEVDVAYGTPVHSVMSHKEVKKMTIELEDRTVVYWRA